MSTPKRSLTVRVTDVPPPWNTTSRMGGVPASSTAGSRPHRLQLHHAAPGDRVGRERVAREAPCDRRGPRRGRRRRAASPSRRRHTWRRPRPHRGAACPGPRPRSAVAPGIGSSFRSGWIRGDATPARRCRRESTGQRFGGERHHTDGELRDRPHAVGEAGGPGAAGGGHVDQLMRHAAINDGTETHLSRHRRRVPICSQMGT